MVFFAKELLLVYYKSTTQLPKAPSPDETDNMSLQEAYTLAHTAQCRLQMAASRPDRNLRFVVGHLMHFQALRVRIVEIEHDMTKRSLSSTNPSNRNGHVDYHIQHKPSSIGQHSPPPSPETYDEDEAESDEDDIAFDDEADDGLSLARFPSAASQGLHPQSQPPRVELEPPELEPDEEDYSDEEEPRIPEEPTCTPQELQRAVEGESNERYTSYYEGVRKCVCHGQTNSPSFDRMWDLPPDQADAREGVTRAVARISDPPITAQTVYTKEQIYPPAPQAVA